MPLRRGKRHQVQVRGYSNVAYDMRRKYFWKCGAATVALSLVLASSVAIPVTALAEDAAPNAVVETAGDELTLDDVAFDSSVHPNMYYNGKAFAVQVSNPDDGGATVLTAGEDYAVKYFSGDKELPGAPKDAGTYTAVVTGLPSQDPSEPNPTGTVTKVFTIERQPVNLRNVFWLSCRVYVYNGKARKPAVRSVDSKGNVFSGITDDRGNRLSRSSYTITYSGRDGGCRRIGTYRVTVRLKGNYSGYATSTYLIVRRPSRASIKSISVGSRSMTVRMPKRPSSYGGNYYIARYRIKGTSRWYLAATSGNSSALTIRGLRRGKCYQVQVNSSHEYGSRSNVIGIVYGPWSTVKTSGKVK